MGGSATAHKAVTSPAVADAAATARAGTAPDDAARADAERTDAARADAAVDVDFPVELSGVVYIGHVLGEGEHLRAAGCRVNRIADEIESSFVERAPLRMSQSLWAWDLHACVHDEYPAAVLLALSAGAESAVELRQARGLRALPGPVGGGAGVV